MKTISLFKVRGTISYPFIFGFYLFFVPALARTALPLYAKTTNESFYVHMLSRQQQTISGTVTFDGMPMAGVAVGVEGISDKTQGISRYTITDAGGKFTVAALSGEVLVFTYSGFKTKKITVGSQKNITVSLEEDVTDLKEVTVNAGYYSVKDSERTGSIAKITAKDIEKQPVTNVLAAMQGRMAGVRITQDSGMPGGGFSILIRGQNSIRSEGNAPLYVIDGVPYASDAIGSTQTSTILPMDSSPLNSIDPDNIESIEVLKDADATAIYGSRGANGVVLVTTKKGKRGATKYTVAASSGSGKVTRFIDMMDTEQYLAMRRLGYANDGINTYPANAYDVNGKWGERYTDWQRELLGGTAEISSLQASVSGGNEQTSFVFSGNSHRQGTVFPGSFLYKKGAAHIALNHESTDKRFKIIFSGGYTAQSNGQPGNDITREARVLPPNAPELYNEDGSLNWADGSWQNPLRNMESRFKSKTFDLLANSRLSYQITDGLQLSSSFGFTDLRHEETRTAPSTMFNPANNITSANSIIFSNHTARQSWIIEPQLNWDGRLWKGRLDVLAGATFQQQSTTKLYQTGSNFPSNSLIYDLASAALLRATNNEEIIYRYNAIYARANYALLERYFLNLTGRRDGSSRFGPGNRFANFGAIGAAWLFSREAFAEKSLPFLSMGKLRGSYGITGNDQIGDYQYLDNYRSSGLLYGGTSGLQPARLYNPNFGWETSKKLELAIELGFLQDRIFVTGAWYSSRSSNQLVGIPLPGTTGFSALQANLDATVRNSGFEATLRTENLRNGNLKWTTSLNITLPRNELVSFPGLDISTYKNMYVIGQPLAIQKLYHYTGTDPQTGLFTFEDVNGDGKITYADDAKTVCSFAPEYYGGFQNTLNYHGWQLDFLFQFTKQQNWNWAAMMNHPGSMQNTVADVSNSYPQQQYTSNANGAALQTHFTYAQSDAAVSDASFVRLKNASLSYTIPAKWSRGIDCRLSLQGQNLLTFTRYKWGDPEFATTGYLPPLRIITGGVQLTF